MCSRKATESGKPLANRATVSPAASEPGRDTARRVRAACPADQGTPSAHHRRRSRRASSPDRAPTAPVYVRPMPSRFDTDTAVDPLGDGVYDARIDAGWWIERGPNGGYIAALLMQAFLAEVADPRTPRPLADRPLPRPCRRGTGAGRRRAPSGRGGWCSYLTARLRQGDRLIATAQAAFAMLNSVGADVRRPELPGLPAPRRDRPRRRPARARADARALRVPPRHRRAVGRAGAPRPRPAAGSASPSRGPTTPPLVAALSDAWYPAVFTRLTERFGVPTVDLTVHLRSIHALQRMRPTTGWRPASARPSPTEGFLEEDGQLWAPDGTLIAHSRQLGLLLDLAPSGPPQLGST